MHLALYRKYRPRTFAEVISQPHITTTLQNQIKAGQIAHAYLLTGSRGTGKTSCAKILAKAVNCLSPDSSKPCLTCANCEVADNSLDIKEMDAASNRKIDDIRDILGEAAYLPSQLLKKVYIVDEVHMLTTEAFNALLKTLEEPPPHVVFILATTEIHKVPATILSRCQRFEFHRINSDDSANALMAVAAKEGFTLEKDAAGLIARLSDGGMRDALSLLDVAVSEAAQSGGAITQETIRNCAGIAGKEHVFAITDAIAAKNGAAALAIVSQLYAKSKDPARLTDELLQHFRNLMLVKLMPGDFSLIAALPEEYDDYTNQAALFSLDAILDALDKLEDCLRIKGRKVETEICLMRLCIGGTLLQTTPPAMRAPLQGGELPPPAPPVVPAPPPPAPPPAPPVQGADFPQWGAILERLDAFQASMLEEVAVSANGSTIVVCGGGEGVKYFFENRDNVATLERIAREVTGQDYAITYNEQQSALPQAPPELPPEAPQTSKLETFLADVKAAGIEIQSK